MTYRQVVLPLVVSNEPFVEGHKLCRSLPRLAQIAEERGRQVDHLPGPLSRVAKVLHHVARHLAGSPGAGVEDDPAQPLRVDLLHDVGPVGHGDVLPLGEELGLERAVPAVNRLAFHLGVRICLSLVPCLERVVRISTKPLERNDKI